jgi:AraC-like DNA-binding protein
MRRHVIRRLAAILAEAERNREEGVETPSADTLASMAAETSRTIADTVGAMLGTCRPTYVRGHRAAVILALIAQTGASSTDVREAVRNLLQMDDKGDHR